MSSLLEKAILDAKALKEAAERTAEAEILEKYHSEVKDALENLLSEAEEDDPLLADPEEDLALDPEMGAEEQSADIEMEESPMLGDEMTMAEEEPSPTSVVKAPMGFAGGQKLCPCPDDGEEIEINLDSLMGQEEVPYGDEDGQMMGPSSAALMEQEESSEIEEIIATNGISNGDDLEEIIVTNGDNLPNSESNIKSRPEDMPAHSITQKADRANALAAMRKKKNESSMMAAGDISAAPMNDRKEIYEDELTEEIVTAVLDSLSEEVEVDYEPKGSGTMNTNSAEFKEAADAIIAKDSADTTEEYSEEKEMRKKIQDLEEALKCERDSRVKDRKFFEKKYKEEVRSKNKLSKQNESILSTAKKLEEKLTEMNATNAKLLYTNRILSDNSLNERQKNKVVEALKKTNSFDEAKTIYETLKSAVAGSNKSDHEAKSLNEAMSGRMSPFLVRERKNNGKKEDIVAERFKKLAGIK